MPFLGRSGLGLLSVCLLAGCSPSAAKPAALGPSPKSAKAAAPARLPLTSDEKDVLRGLRKHGDHLLTKVGERNENNIWELAEAADYLAGELESLGFALERQGYETEHVAAQNLVVTVPGGARGDQVLVLAAHYDSAIGAPGRESALSTAALLEVARMMRDARLLRTLRIAFFSMGEPPHAVGQGCGAGHYARGLMAEARRAPRPGLPDAVATFGIIDPIGVILLGQLGNLKDGRISANWDPEGAPVVSVRVPIAASESAFRLESLFAEGFDDEGVELIRGQLSGTDCDGRSFSAEGVSVVALGRQVPFGPPEPAQGTAPPEGAEKEGTECENCALSEQEYEDAARIVMRIRAGIGRVLGETPSNDITVTTPSSGFR